MSIAERIGSVLERVATSCTRAGRAPSEVTLVAVSKTRPIDDILEAYAAGQRHFGENRVQEALQKVAAGLPDDLTLRMVGHLQKNKVRDACDVFHCVDSVDSAELVDRIERLATRPMEILIQVKMGDEPSKSGVAPDDLAAILASCDGRRRVRVAGLMCVPPLDVEPRPHFQRLRELRDDNGGVRRLPQLSMGMSHDFEVAIEEGATLIRVGEAIFGPRERTG